MKNADLVLLILIFFIFIPLFSHLLVMMGIDILERIKQWLKR